jgi:N-acetylglucosamine malate deacetylase 1
MKPNDECFSLKKLRVLFIGAHPDDCEYLAGGTAIKFKSLGHIVKFLSITNGDTGHYSICREELAKIRRIEAENAGLLYDIESEVLGISSNQLVPDISTRELIICKIREFKPDIIFCHRPNDYHPDHRYSAILVQDSSYALRIPHVCPEVPFLMHSPLMFYMFDEFKKPYEFFSDVVVDIDNVLDKKVEMLHCHKSQFYDWLPWIEKETDQVPVEDVTRFIWLMKRQKDIDRRTSDKFREKLKARYGTSSGLKVECSEAFEICEYGGHLIEDKLNDYFHF